MRYLVVCLLAGLLAWPQSVAAQTAEQAPANAALAIHAYRLPPQFMLRASYYYYVDVDPLSAQPTRPSTTEDGPKLDDAGVGVPPKAPHNEIERLEAGVLRAKIALGFSMLPLVVGGLLFGISYSTKQPIVCIVEPCPGEERDSLRVPGATVLLGGVTWMIVAGTIHGVRRRKLHDLRKAEHGMPRRVEFDPRASRFVF